MAALAFAAAAPQARATLYFADDFSTFTPGNLVGQNSWTQLGASATLPLQVSGGYVTIPGGQTVDNQDAAKAFATQASPISSTVYVGMSLRIDSAPNSGVSYFMALMESSGNFANARLAAINNTSLAGTYFLEARYTGQGGNPFVPGVIPLNYGTTYNVILEAIITPTGAGEGINVYVDPTSNDISMETPYLSAPASTGFIIPPVGFYQVIISQFASGTVFNDGLGIDHVNVASTFGEAAQVVPEPSSFLLAGLAGLGLVAVWRRTRRR
ncbi:MAG: PEP-CTERM sorting domain-containing protein [Pirellulales bacterium]